MIEQLKRLSEFAPGILVKHRSEYTEYQIGEYVFWQAGGVFHAWHKSDSHPYFDRPALAWLTDALKMVIKARGWMWTIWEDLGEGAKIFTDKSGYEVDDYDTEAATLLAALIAALEGEG